MLLGGILTGVGIGFTVLRRIPILGRLVLTLALLTGGLAISWIALQRLYDDDLDRKAGTDVASGVEAWFVLVIATVLCVVYSEFFRLRNKTPSREK